MKPDKQTDAASVEAPAGWWENWTFREVLSAFCIAFWIVVYGLPALLDYLAVNSRWSLHSIPQHEIVRLAPWVGKAVVQTLVAVFVIANLYVPWDLWRQGWHGQAAAAAAIYVVVLTIGYILMFQTCATRCGGPPRDRCQEVDRYHYHRVSSPASPARRLEVLTEVSSGGPLQQRETVLAVNPRGQSQVPYFEFDGVWDDYYNPIRKGDLLFVLDYGNRARMIYSLSKKRLLLPEEACVLPVGLLGTREVIGGRLAEIRRAEPDACNLETTE